ncbi:MAG: hypothetical protein KJ822_16665, partial [Proteobacteria bacterium]|nr:hypothetical protein [Pseudomonadota bacterium]
GDSGAFQEHPHTPWATPDRGFLAPLVPLIAGPWPSCRCPVQENIVQLLECIENADKTGKKVTR